MAGSMAGSMAPACKASVTFGLMSAVILLVYWKTLPPTVRSHVTRRHESVMIQLLQIVGGDSGDIVVSAWKLSIPHPPGAEREGGGGGGRDVNCRRLPDHHDDRPRLHALHPAVSSLGSSQRQHVMLSAGSASQHGAWECLTPSLPRPPRCCWASRRLSYGRTP